MTTEAAISRAGITRPPIILLGMLTAVDAMSIDSYLPALPAIAIDLQASPAGAQATLAIFLFGIALGQAVWGPVSDRFGRRGPLLVGLALFCAASLFAAMTADLPTLMIARFGQALGASAGLVIARAIVSDLWDEQAAARLYSILMQVLGVTAIVSPLIGGGLLVLANWRLIFVMLLVMGMLAALWSYVRIPESLPRAVRRSDQRARVAYLALMRTPRFGAAALACAFATATMFATLAGMPFLFVDHYGWSTSSFSQLYAASSVAFVIVCQLNFWLLDRSTDAALLCIGLILQLLIALAMTVLIMGSWGGSTAMAVLWLLLMANLGFTLGNATSVAMRFAPRDLAGSASGAIGVSQFALSGLVAPLTTMGADIPGSIVLTTLACAVLAWATMKVSMRGRGVQREEASAP